MKGTVLLIMMVVVLQERTSRPKELDYNFLQNDYDLKFSRMELESFNKEYVAFATLRTTKYNRTCPVVNFTFKPKVDIHDLEIIVQAYKFMSNEYRHFPLRFEVNAPKALKANMIGIANIRNCGNFTGFPLLKGVTYHICNWTPDKSKFPPFIPDGDYMVQLQAELFSTEIGCIKLYASASRPLQGK